MNNVVSQKNLGEILKHTIPHRAPVLAISSPGIGKSSIFKQAAKACHHEFRAMHPATLDPVDFSGMPAPVTRGGTTRIMRLLDDYLGEVFDAKEPTLLLLDELGQASPATQAACAPLLLDRRVGKYELPEHVTVCAATNNRAHRAGANQILTHLISRMASVLQVECKNEDWEEWAVTTRLRPEVIGFLRFRRQLLNDFNAEKAYAETQPYPNPRSWEKLSGLLDCNLPRSVELAAYAGCVGPGASQEFSTYLTSVRELPNLDEMIDNPKSFKMPEGPNKANVRYAIATGIALRADQKNLGNVLNIVTKMHDQKHGEFAACTFRDVLRIVPNVMTRPEFTEFASHSPVAKTIMRV